MEKNNTVFKKGRGTRDAVGVVRTIGERYIEKGKGICICFVDLEKAFDRVTWDKLLAILKNKGIDWKERRLIWNLYIGQRISIKVRQEETEEVEINRGVTQG